MANTYTEAIALNNKGVAMIETGDFPNAVALLKKALHIIKGNTKEKKPLPDLESSSAFRWSSINRFPPEQHSDTASGSFFVFRRALLIVQSDFSSGRSCLAETAAILYNLSLAFHIEGHNANNSTLLDKALKAYKIALAICSCRRKRTCKKIQTDQLLAIAINNNMAMIYQEFMEFDRARVCFISVSRALRSLGNVGFLEQTEYQGLVLNLLMGRHETTLAAAA